MQRTDSSPSMRTPVILNVDDREPMRYARSRVLRGAGYEVVEAVSGTDALGLIAERHPQLVILDVALPDMTGFEVCRRIKQDPATTHVLVLHVSAVHHEVADRVMGLEMGADGFMVEPIEPVELLAQTKALLRLAEREAENRRLIDQLSSADRRFDAAGKEAQAAQSLSDEKYRLLFDSIDEGFCVIDMIYDDRQRPCDYRFVETNPAFSIHTGLTDALGKTIRELAPDHEQHWFDLYGDVAMTGKAMRFENYAAELNRWYDVYAFRIGGPDQRRVAVLFSDITERRRQYELSAEQSRLLNLSNDAIIVRAPDDRIVYWNRGAQEIYGWTEQEARGRNLYDLLKTEFAQPVEQILSQLRRDNRWIGECTHLRRDGVRVTVATRWALDRDAQGRPTSILQSENDITEWKIAETRLRQSEEFVRRISDIAPSMLYLYDLIEKRTIWGNRQMHEGLGYAPEDIRRMDQRVLSTLLHPEDWLRYQDHLGRLHRLADGETAEFEYRMRHADGSWRWLHSRDMVFRRLPDGGVEQIVGAAMDVTERTHMEQALRRSHAFVRQVIDTDPNFVFAKDREGRFTLVNQAVADCYGVTVEALMGKTDADFNPDAEQVAHFRRMDLEVMDTLEERTIPEEEITDAAGHRRFLQTVKRPIVDEKGLAVQVLGVATDITARKRGEQELARVTERLSAILQSAGVGIYGLDAQGLASFINPVGAAMFGYDTEELIGRNLHGVLHHTHVDGREYSQEACPIYRSLMDGRFHSGDEEIFFKKDGTPVSVSFTSSPIVEEDRVAGAVVVVRDVTEHKRAQDALRESEARLRLALAAGGMGAWDVDLRTNETTWDAQDRALLGVSMEGEAPTPERFYESVHQDDRLRVRQAVEQAVASAGMLEHEFRVVRPDGEVRWLVAKGRVLRDDRGRPVRMVGVNFDVTERKRTDDRLRSFTLELEWRVAERTEELQRSQEQLRALATELNLTEQRERKRLATDLHDYLAQLLVLVRLKLAQLKRASSMDAMREMGEAAEEAVKEALTYTRTLVAQLSPPVLHEFGLPAALHWLSKQMVRQELSVTVTQRVPDNVPLAEDQSVLLFQSVRELLMNIKKHAGTQSAHVTIERREREVRITVGDDGAGMDLGAAMATHPESSVMSSKFGLFSIRERMRAIGGRFELDSAPGRGTTAILVVPLVLQERDLHNHDKNAPAEESPLESAEQRQAGMPPCETQADRHSPHQIRVLLADDHLMVREGLRMLLKEESDIAVVGEAWDGEEAVAFADRLRPDVVIMDVNMPRLDGIEATRRIKAAFRSIAVVGISVNASAEVEAAMRTSGADAFLSKEAAGQEICQTIKALGKAGVQ